MDLVNRSATPKDRTVSDDATRLQIVEHLIDGKTIPQIAELVGYHRTQVQMVACAHGYPTAKYMERSRDLLAARVSSEAP